MAWSQLQSIPDVAAVEVVRGQACPQDAVPDLLLEVPHGATRLCHFERTRDALRGDFPADLRDFFFVNTDVGAPEVAQRVAEHLVALLPRRSAVVVRALVPRTFVDCNRVIDATAVPHGSRPGEPTPGLHVYVTDPADRSLLLGRHAAYQRLATAAYDAVCGRGGVALMVHSYAPRSIEVPVDEQIVQRLRAEYEPHRIGNWAMRAPVDLITADSDGVELAAADLAAHVEREFRAAGFEVARNQVYSLHPAAMAHRFAARHPGRTLCLELRRDLLVGRFTPFAEMLPDPAAVDRAALPLARAVAAVDRIPDA